jgi:Mitochondrial carrier protein
MFLDIRSFSIIDTYFVVLFERQVQPISSSGQYKGVWSSLSRIWREEGFLGFMRGNGINCLRIVPYSAVQFTTYEQLKKVWSSASLFPSARLLTCYCSSSRTMGRDRLIPQPDLFPVRWQASPQFVSPISYRAFSYLTLI